MLDRTDHANTTAGDEERSSAGDALQHEIMMDLLVTVTGVGAVVTLVLLVVHSLFLS